MISRETTSSVYLASNVLLEPLRLNWHLMPYMLSPIEYGLNIFRRQLPLLQSYLEAPEMHAEMASDAFMMGGAFIDQPVSRVSQVADVKRQTETKAHDLIQVAKDYLAILEIMLASGDGTSMENLYQHVPTSLSGAVEFCYDANNFPKLRIYEEIVARTIGTDISTSIRLSREPEDKRKFAMTTPRVLDEESHHLSMRFDDERIDCLAKAKAEGCSMGELVEVTELKANELSRYLVSTKPKKQRCRDKIVGVSVSHFGHAGVLIESACMNLLIDPVIAWDNSHPGRYSFVDLPDQIDYLIISHAHVDHFCLETLLQLRHKTKHIVVPNGNPYHVSDTPLKNVLRRLGFTSIISLETFAELNFKSGRIISFPFMGEHAELDILSKQSVYIELMGKKLFFSVDSACCDAYLYKHVFDQVGQVDALFTGMECEGAPLTWLYGPLLPRRVAPKVDQSRRLAGANAEQAWAMVGAMRPKRAFVYAMGQEPWIRHYMGPGLKEDGVQTGEVRKFMTLCRREGIQATYICGCGPLDI